MVDAAVSARVPGSSAPLVEPVAFRWAESRIANPVLRRVLRSPLHWLVSRWLLLLSYEGRRSGRRFTTPVLYVRDGDAYVVTTVRDSAVWWRNFTNGHPATLWVGGEPVPVEGRAETDPSAVADWIASLRDRGHERLPAMLGAPADAASESLESAARTLVYVRFSPVE